MDWNNEAWFIKQLEAMNRSYKTALATKSAPAHMVVPDGTKAFISADMAAHATKTAFSAPVMMRGDAIKGLLDELSGGDYLSVADIKANAFRRYLRGAQWQDVYHEARMVVLSPRQVTEFVKAGMSSSEIKAVMQEAQDTLGGFLVGGETSDQIFAAAATISVVRPNGATVDRPGRNGSIGMPSVARGSQDTYPSALRGAWVSETQTGIPEHVSLGMIKPEINVWRVPVRLSKSLLEDSGSRFLPIMNGLIGQTVGAAEDRSFLVGKGAGQPLGILAEQSPGVLVNGDVRVSTSGAPETITGDGVVNTVYALPAQYRERAVATCTSATMKLIRTLKDGAGRYIFDESAGTLCGVKVRESESMPQIAANAYPLLVGDMSGYCVADHIALSIEVFDDSSTAEVDQILINVRRRLGGTVGAGYRFSALKVAA